MQALKDVEGFTTTDRTLRGVRRNLVKIREFIDANRTAKFSNELYAEFEIAKNEADIERVV